MWLGQYRLLFPHHRRHLRRFPSPPPVCGVWDVQSTTMIAAKLG
ncbi:hypothetical protein HanIR_Chr12g0565411 [Helianthus annuus]|nr:hypothetical protein HanIR_Chr12g0565411 [Helianthus annuus]